MLEGLEDGLRLVEQCGKLVRESAAQLVLSKIISLSLQIPSRSAKTTAGANIDNPLFINELASSLPGFRKLKLSLKLLLDSARKCAEILEDDFKNVAFYVGIRSLPPEILADIFELAATTRTEFPSVASQVCRYFRDVSAKNPRLWAKLSNLQTRSQLQMCILRSAAVGLHISVTPYTRGCTGLSLESFMDIVTPHSRRWIEFEFTGLPSASDTQLSRLKGLNLPLLTHLTSTPNMSVRGESPDYMTAWHAPNVQFFMGIDTTPPINNIGEHLVHCTFHITQRFRDLSLYFGSLQSTFRLERLVFIIHADHSAHHFKIPKAILPSLLCLELSISNKVKPRVIRSLIQALDLPIASTMSLTLDHADFDLDATLPPNVYPALRHFECRMINTSPMCQPLSDPSIISVLFNKFPSVSSLTIEAPGHRERWADLPRNNIPPLRYLRLERCHQFGQMVILTLIANMRKEPMWQTFERLDLIECRGFSEEFLSRLKRNIDQRLRYEL